MTKTVIVTVAMTDSPPTFAAGTAAAGVQVTLLNAAGAQIAQEIVTADPCVATFTGIEPGVVTATAQTVDSAGAPLGSAVTSAPYTIDSDLVSIKVPLSISIAAQ